MYADAHVTLIAIADGHARGTEFSLCGFDQADACVLDRADRVVVGGPSHAQGVRYTSTGGELGR